MMRFVFLFLTVGLAVQLHAQESRKFRVKPGEITTSVIPDSAIYRFSGFRTGTIQLINNAIFEAQLNYNRLFRDIEFISDKGDTLPLNPIIMKKVVIGEHVFYGGYPGDYVEVVGKYDNTCLAVSEIIGLVKTEWTYGRFDDGVSPYQGLNDRTTPTYRTLYTNRSQHGLLLTRQADFYVIDRNNRIHPAKKRVILRIFPSHAQKIHRYMKEHSPNLKKEDELRQLLAFCNEISR